MYFYTKLNHLFHMTVTFLTDCCFQVIYYLYGKCQSKKINKKTLSIFIQQLFRTLFDSFMRLTKNLQIYNNTKLKYLFNIILAFLIYCCFHIRSLGPMINNCKAFYCKCQSIFIQHYFKILFDSLIGLKEKLKMQNHTKLKHLLHVFVIFLDNTRIHINSLGAIIYKFKTFCSKCKMI